MKLNDPITFFMYHDIRDPACTAFPKRYQGTSFLTPSQFDGQLQYILKHYRVVSVGDLVMAARGGPVLPPRPAVLTFDDGLLDHFTEVYPRLARRGLSGAFFVPTTPVEMHRVMESHKVQFILAAVQDERQIVDEIFTLVDSLRTSRYPHIPSNPHLWDQFSVSRWSNNTWTREMVFVTRLLRTGFTSDIRRYIVEQLFSCHVTQDEAGFAKGLYMTIDQLRCLVKGGMEVGGHGYDSRDLSTLTEEEQRSEITRNFEFLRETVFDGVALPLYFSYPHGGVDGSAVTILEQAGCTAALTTRAELETGLNDLMRLPRFNAPSVFPHHEDSPPSAPTRELYERRVQPARAHCERANWRIVCCGIQEQGLEVADFLLSHDIPISHFVTISPELGQKNKASGWVSYERFAGDRGIPIYHARSYGLSSAEDQAFFRQHQFDLLLLGGWQRLVPAEILETLRLGGIGQHGSSEPLPRGRGRSPLNWSLIQDRQRLVWNLFMLTAGVDDGALIDTQTFEINDWDTCRTLYYKVSVSVQRMLARTVPKLFDGQVETRQQVGTPTFYAKRSFEDGVIDWQRMSVRQIYNLVRAVTRPYPGAFTHDSEGRIAHIWIAQPWDACLPFYGSSECGEIVERFANGDFVVKCTDGLLLVTDASDPAVFVGKVYRSPVDPTAAFKMPYADD